MLVTGRGDQLSGVANRFRHTAVQADDGIGMLDHEHVGICKGCRSEQKSGGSQWVFISNGNGQDVGRSGRAAYTRHTVNEK